MTEWSNPSTPQQPVILRERAGWGAPVALTLVAATLSVAQPGLLLLIPLGLLLLAAPPRRPALVIVGAFLLAFVLMGQAGDVLWWFGRGWALMLGALFLVITVLRPESSFLDRALGTVFGTALGTAGLLVVRSGWTSLDLTVAQKLRDSASAAEAQLSPAFAARNWNPQLLESMRRAADLQALVFPALLALASLAALGVTWWVWRRVTVRDANPLSALREFRFRDELVWLVVAAVLLVIPPLCAATFGVLLPFDSGLDRGIAFVSPRVALFCGPPPNRRSADSGPMRAPQRSILTSQ